MKINFNLLLMLIIPTIVFCANTLHFNISYAALTQEHVNVEWRELKDVSNALQSNNTSNVSNALHTIINNITKSICNMAICPSDTVSSEQADIAIIPLNETIKSLQSGNITAAQNQITNAYYAIGELSK